MNIDDEIWKDIEGFEGRYQASNKGNVLSLNFKNTGKAKQLKPACRASGHYVMLSDYKWHAVDAIVAKLFVQGYSIGKIVRHIDGNVNNNSSTNLEWSYEPTFVDLDGEQWHDVIGYEGLYQISNKGRVRSLIRWRGEKKIRLRKPICDGKKTSVPSVLLKKGGMPKMWWICRLVAINFKNDYREGYQIVHIDGNKYNNCVENIVCIPCDLDEVNEQWRDVVGYEGLYQVSNIGRVRSLNYRRRNEYRLRKPLYDKRNGYYEVMLTKNKRSKHYRVHRLVAMAFVPGYREGLYVNHKDENKLNNHANNLEWVTASENNAYGSARERQAISIHQRLSKPVERIDDKGIIIESYKSQSAAASAYGYNIGRLSGYCRKGIDGWRYVGDTKITSPKKAREVIAIEDDQSIEEWRDIEGYNGIYMISSKGRVKSLARKRVCSKSGQTHMTKETILNGSINRNGYRVISLNKGGRAKNFRIHRLVATAFLGEVGSENMVVNHINENPLDNRAVNLEWCSFKDNLNYGTCNKRQGETRRKNGVDKEVIERRNKQGLYGAEKPVLCIDDDGCIVKRYRSINEAAHAVNITSSSHISACCKGKRPSAGGYKWAYDE